MKTVMCFGTFDNFHLGHSSYLKQASLHGDEMIVVIARNRTVEKVKGKTPQDNENVRRKRVEEEIKQLNIKGIAVKGLLGDRWQVIRRYRPQIICLGYDQKVDLEKLKSLITEEGFFCKIKRLKSHYPDKYKSSYCRQ